MEAPLDWRSLRIEFPLAVRATPLHIAGGLPVSRRAVDAGQRALEEALAGTGSTRDDAEARIAAVCRRMAALLHTAPDTILPIVSRHHGLDLVAQALGPRVGVLTFGGDDPELGRAFTARGHWVTSVAIEDGVRDMAARLERALRADIRGVVTSSILPGIGLRHDLPALAEVCRARGVPLVVDAFPSAGLLRLEAPAAADVLLCGLHGGAGVLAGQGGFVRDHAGAAAGCRDEALAPAMAALGGAIDLVDTVGIERLEARTHALTGALHARLDAGGFTVCSPRAREERGATTIIEVLDPCGTAARLAAAGVFVEACAAGLRASVHMCTLEEDLDRLVEALQCVRRGAPIAAADAPAGPHVCVDLNGVLDAYDGWRGADHWDPPRAGAHDFLAALREAGCRITIFTTRHYSGAWAWLLHHDLARFVQDVTDRKPAADVFIDDHAICFRGDFHATLAEVRAFAPHWHPAPASSS